jgi:hypothetical protein
MGYTALLLLWLVILIIYYVADGSWDGLYTVEIIRMLVLRYTSAVRVLRGLFLVKLSSGQFDYVLKGIECVLRRTVVVARVHLAEIPLSRNELLRKSEENCTLFLYDRVVQPLHSPPALCVTLTSCATPS